MAFPGNTVASTFRDILQIDNSNAGISTSLKVVKDGAGNQASLYISDDQIKIKPENDDTTSLLEIQDKDGNQMLVVDSTNDDVKVFGNRVNTQYAYFGCSSSSTLPTVADTHYAVAFSTMIFSSTVLSLGNGGNPAETLDLSSINQSDELVTYLWYIPDNITIENVYVWTGASTATGDSLTFHLMSYAIDTSDDAAGGGGDLSDGTVIADHTGTVDSDGYEATIYKSLTIQSANIDAGRVGIFTMAGDGTSSDYALNVTVKYHLR